MRISLPLLIVVSLLPLAALAAPSQGLDIAAVVGDGAISSYDVENRIRFIIATANFTHEPDVVARIRPQVVRALIDEKLQLDEAKKNNISITDKEVDQAITTIEQQRNMPPGAIDDIMKRNSVPRSTFTSQIRAQLAWNRLLMKNIRPHVRVSDEEIALASKKITAQEANEKHPEEVKIAVIALPVDKSSREQEVKRAGDKLAGEIRQGASFEEVSRHFSSGAASTSAFWIRPEQLDPAVAKALVHLKSGQITDPVRTAVGYSIVKVYDMRLAEAEKAQTNTEVNLKEILLKLKPDASNKEAGLLLQIAEDVAKHPGSCQEKGVSGIADPDDVDIAVNYQSSTLADLPPAIKIIAENLKPGDISTPFASDEGIRLYMLCDKKDVSAGTPDHEQVGKLLLQQKMELEAQKYMRNLRREVFIEVR